MPVPLSQFLPKVASRSHLLTDSWGTISSAQSSQLTPSSPLLYWCCRWPGAEDPKGLHRPDFVTALASFGALLLIHFFIHHSIHSFISLAHTISPPLGLSSISSSHHHTSTLASSSLSVIYPPHERFILPSFPIALLQTPTKTPYRFGHDFVRLAHKHRSRGHQAPALTFHSVHNLLRNSPFGEQAYIASYPLSRTNLESGAVISTRPYAFPRFSRRGPLLSLHVTTMPCW